MALQQLAMPRAQKELRGIGVAVTDSHGKILPLVDIIQQLASKGLRREGLPDRQANRALFGELGDSFSRAFAPFRPVVDQLFAVFSKLGKALGITGQSADDNVSSWDAFGTVGAGVGETLGKIAGVILPILTNGIDLAADAVGFFKGHWEQMKPVVLSVFQTISGVVDMVSGLMNGDWKKVWDGAVDTVVGAAKLVVKHHV